MEAIKKQATKLREQVAKQQQSVLRHLGRFSNEDVTVDEADLQCHQKLQDLYSSTKAAKHLQRNIVRGIEGFIATSSKLIEISRKLADDCCKYGVENQNTGSSLAKAALHFGNSHKSMEDERGTLLGILDEQIILEGQINESFHSVTLHGEVNVAFAHDNFSSNKSEAQGSKSVNDRIKHVYFDSS